MLNECAEFLFYPRTRALSETFESLNGLVVSYVRAYYKLHAANSGVSFDTLSLKSTCLQQISWGGRQKIKYVGIRGKFNDKRVSMIRLRVFRRAWKISIIRKDIRDV